MASRIGRNLFVIQQVVFFLLLIFAVYAIFIRDEKQGDRLEFSHNPADTFNIQQENLLETELQLIQRYKCPSGMAVIPGGEIDPSWIGRDAGKLNDVGAPIRIPPFCMDVFEYPNVRYAIPRVRVSYLEAKELCLKEGKRLCTEEEWELACSGTAGQLYTYGAERQAWRCNTDGVAVGDCRDIAPAGSHAGCYNRYGVYDLNGNVSEWVEQDCDGCGVVRGGTAWEAEYGQSCFSRHTHPDDENHYCDDGLRCCATVTEP